MTTSPVVTITDELIAEIEKAAKSKMMEGFMLVHNLDCRTILALISERAELKRDAEKWRARQAKVLRKRNPDQSMQEIQK